MAKRPVPRYDFKAFGEAIKTARKGRKDYTIKDRVMDKERLKNGGSVLTEKYFEEQLEKIRGIRLSKRKFY